MLLLVLGFLSQTRQATLTAHGMEHGHSWHISITAGELDVKHHHLGARRNRFDEYVPTIDGVSMIGTSGGTRDDVLRRIGSWGKADQEIPEDPIVIRAFTVWIDREKVELPRKLWQDLLEPDVIREDSTRALDVDVSDLGVKVAKNGSSLNVTLVGSDGGGSYDVWWHIAKTGRVSRGFYDLEVDWDWQKHNGYHAVPRPGTR
jgi:hypothetical protein